MKSSEVRSKFISFYKRQKHKEIPSASLVPENDPTTLFTSSGMQPLIPYLLGAPHPLGKRLVNSQKSFRIQDIDEVGDNRHTTFFEMLGNWSLGDYFKKEQLPWIFEFLTKELGLDKKKLHVSVFEGTKDVPRDEESVGIWESLGIPAERIYFYGVKNNWWSRSGVPEKMPVGEPGGPDSEVFYDFGVDLKLHEKSPFKDQKCHPNCECGRFMEIANSVFMQYQKQADGKLKELAQKNVDFGGGLERMVAATENTPDIFEIDTFNPIIRKIEEISNQRYSVENNKPIMRVIADHIKAATLLIVDGVIPSNKGQGYVLRRLLRRASVKYALLMNNPNEFLSPDLTTTVLEIYKDSGHIADIQKQKSAAYTIVEEELRKFQKTLAAGLKVLQKTECVNGKMAFDLYQTHGFPLEVTIELLRQKGKTCTDVGEFTKEFKRHQELSRTASAGMFKGGLADHSIETTKLHTVTHLLHKALRMVLGDHVAQKGSNITVERLRFDFSHPQKVTPEELKAVEEIINEEIKKDLPVSFTVSTYEEAVKGGAMAFFSQKYPEKVKVYTIGDFSKEICGGPHVERTGALGHFKILKEESAGAGIRRIYAVVGK